MGICTVRSVIDIFRWTFLGSGSIPIRVNQLERTYTYSCQWFKRSLDGSFCGIIIEASIAVLSVLRNKHYIGCGSIDAICWGLGDPVGIHSDCCAWLDRHQPDWPTSGKLKYFNGHHRLRTNVQDTCLANYLLIWMIAILFSGKKHVSFYNIPQMWVNMRTT